MIYRLQFDSLLTFVNADDYAILKRWKNPSPIEGWKELRLGSLASLNGEKVMGLHSVMIWEIALFEAMSALIGTACQALSVRVDDRSYLAIHISQTLDCLDRDHSQFKRFKNRNIGVEAYVLRADYLGDAHLFCIPDDGYSAIFVSSQFKSQFEQEAGSGLSFIPIESR